MKTDQIAQVCRLVCRRRSHNVNCRNCCGPAQTKDVNNTRNLKAHMCVVVIYWFENVLVS